MPEERSGSGQSSRAAAPLPAIATPREEDTPKKTIGKENSARTSQEAEEEALPSGREKKKEKMQVFEENLARFLNSAKNKPSELTPRGREKEKEKEKERVKNAAIANSPYLQAALSLPKRERKPEAEDLGEKRGQRPEAVFRKRYLKMLQQMATRTAKKEKEQEQEQKRREDEKAKLRAKLGVDNVAPRLMKQPSWKREEAEGEEAGERRGRGGKLEAAAEDEEAREESEEERRKRKEAAERNKLLREKSQNFLLQLAEKRRTEEEQQEEKRQKEDQTRLKLRSKVMEAVGQKRAQEGLDVMAVLSQPQQGAIARALAEQEAESPQRRGEVEKTIQSRSRRFQDRFSSEQEEDAWIRKKYAIAEGDKMFCIAGGTHSYQGIREALLERGWREHREEESMIFDLKWTVKTTDIAFKALNKDQVVNHFAKNSCITTKVGLTRNLRNLKWFEDVDMDHFFPRSYDLHDPEELYDFVEDFKMVAAENTLKRFLADGEAMTDQQGKPLGPDFQYVVQLTLLAVEAHVRRSELVDAEDEDEDEGGGAAADLSPSEWALILGEPSPVLGRPGQASSDVERDRKSVV